MDLCKSAKQKLNHYEQCSNPTCFTCASGRFLVSVNKGKLSPLLQHHFVTIQCELFSMGKEIQKSVQEFTQAKENMSEACESIRKQLVLQRIRYATLKNHFTTLLAEIFEVWKSIKDDKLQECQAMNQKEPIILPQLLRNPRIKRASREWENVVSSLRKAAKVET